MCLSTVGLEPTPSEEDQNTQPNIYSSIRMNLESGALDHSATLTFSVVVKIWQNAKFVTSQNIFIPRYLLMLT